MNNAKKPGLVPILHFGFIPQSIVARFQSQDYQQRVDASNDVLELIKSTPLREIDVPNTLIFLENYVSDQNYLIAQNAAQITSALILKLGTKSMEYMHAFIHLILVQFEDRRRTVCQLGQTLMVDLLTVTDPYDVINELVRSSSGNPPPKVSMEIFRCLTNMITQESLDPSILLQFPFYFDSALLSAQTNIRQAVLWCIDYLKANFPQVHDQLSSLLSREASIALGKANNNPATAVQKNRNDALGANRTVLTAGTVEAAKAKAMPFNRAMPLSRNQYKRPSLPSGKGARQINIIASMSRPVTSKNTFGEDDQPPNFVHIEEENFSQTYQPRRPALDTIFDSSRKDEPAPPPQQTTPKRKSVVKFLNDQLAPPITHKSGNTVKFSFDPEPTKPQAQRNEDLEFDDRPLPRLAAQEEEPKRFLTEPSPKQSKKKQSPVQAKHRLITLDAILPKDQDSENDPLPKITQPKRAKTEMKHISYSNNDDDLPEKQISPAPSGERPIKASGFYNLGDDIDFDDVTSPIHTEHAKPKPQLSMSLKRPKPKSKPKPANRTMEVIAAPPPRQPKFPMLSEKLKSSEWSDQNEAILEFLNSSDQLAEQINSNLRDLLTPLLECSASLRSALAKNALNCLLSWIKNPAISFENVADMAGTGLLQILTTSKSKHFIAELSGECFVTMIDSITVQRAAEMLTRERNRKHAEARAKIAFAMNSVAQRLDDPSILLKSLVALVKDANPDVRKNSRTAIQTIAMKSSNFRTMVINNFANEEDRNTVYDALK